MNRWNVIPESWRADVDKSLLEVLCANRKKIDDAKVKANSLEFESPVRFSKELSGVWFAHNTFYRELTPLMVKFSKQTSGIGSKDRNLIKNILNDMALVDGTTLNYTLAIKKILSKQERITLPLRSFYLSYQIDHAKYARGEICKKQLISEYHSDSEELFEQRANKNPLNKVLLLKTSGFDNADKELFLKTKRYYSISF